MAKKIVALSAFQVIRDKCIVMPSYNDALTIPLSGLLALQETRKLH